MEVVNGICLDSDDVMVSYDVSSLFTNVPIQEAIDVIRDMLQEDETLDERTVLSPGRIAELLETCLRSTYFSYQGDFYEQVEGAAMGSPVSAVVANLYMEFFEEMALTSAPDKPALWKRYVDDIWCIVKKGKEEELLDHLNSVRPSIKFTMELEKDGKLPFLDCSLQRGEDGMLTSTVYRKPTHTDRYLHYTSHHPVHVKRGVVRSLYDRARRVTNMESDLGREEDHLHRVFSNNGYPEAIIRAGSEGSPGRREEEVRDEQGDKPLVVTIPYVSGLSEDIRRVCRRFNIKTAFKSGMTLRAQLSRVKDKLPTSMSSCVVYSIPCSCGKVYIGETTRRLEQRISEHQDACRKGEEKKSAVAEHAWKEHHPIRWQETSVIDRASRFGELRVKEALHIHLTPEDQRFNRDVGLELPGCWVSTLKTLCVKPRPPPSV